MNVLKLLMKQVWLKLIQQSLNIFTINIGIASYLVYYKYMNHDKENGSKYDYVYYAKNY